MYTQRRILARLFFNISGIDKTVLDRFVVVSTQ